MRPIGTGSPCDVFAQNCWRTAPLAQNCWRTAPLLHHTLTLRRKLSLLEPANSWPPCFGTALVAFMFVVTDVMLVRAVPCDSGPELCPTCAIVRNCHAPPHPGTKSGMASYAINCHTLNRRRAPSAHASPRNERQTLGLPLCAADTFWILEKIIH